MERLEFARRFELATRRSLELTRRAVIDELPDEARYLVQCNLAVPEGAKLVRDPDWRTKYLDRNAVVETLFWREQVPELIRMRVRSVTGGHTVFLLDCTEKFSDMRDVLQYWSSRGLHGGDTKPFFLLLPSCPRGWVVTDREIAVNRIVPWSYVNKSVAARGKYHLTTGESIPSAKAQEVRALGYGVVAESSALPTDFEPTRAFREDIGRRLRAHGFESKEKGLTFVRQFEHGVHSLQINCVSRRPELIFASCYLTARFRGLEKLCQPLLSGGESLRFGYDSGEITQYLPGEAKGRKVDSPEDVLPVVDAAYETIVTKALPFFERLSSLEAADAAYAGEDTDARAVCLNERQRHCWRIAIAFFLEDTDRFQRLRREIESEAVSPRWQKAYAAFRERIDLETKRAEHPVKPEA